MDITVFGTPICPTCKNVTTYLDKSDIEYEYKTIGEDVNKEEVDQLAGRSVRSVPVILVNGDETDFVGLQQRIQMITLTI